MGALGCCLTTWSSARTGQSLTSQTLNILARYGAEAHLWLPGAAIPVLGPELVVNGGGTSVTGWTLASSTVTSVNGEFVINASAQYAGMNQTVTLVTGARYILSARNRLGTAASAFTCIRQASGEAIVNLPNMTTTDTVSSIEFVAPDTDGFIELMTLAVGSGVFYADDISLRQVLSYSNYISGITAGNYLDSVGTDLMDSITQVDQPVGLVLDAAGTIGPDVLVNGSFDVDSNWSKGVGWSIADGTAIHVAGTQANLYQAGVLTLGKTYRIDIDIASLTGTVTVYCGSTSSSIISTTEQTTLVLTCSGDVILYLRSNDTTGACVIRSISVREVTGIHAVQATTANKPILRRGLTNFALYSMDFPNAAWSKTNMTAVGTLVSRTSTTLPCYTGNTTLYTVPIGTKLTVVARVSAGTVGGFFGLRFQGTFPHRIDMLVNLATGAFTTATNAFVLDGAEVVADGGAWLCVVRLTVASSLGVRIHFGPTNSTVATSSWEGATAALCDANLHGVARFDGHVTADQIIAAGGIPRTVASALSTESGQYTWQFDGSNDALLGTLNTGTTGVAIVGARPLIPSAWGMVLGSGAQNNTLTGMRLGVNGGQTKWTLDTVNGVASSSSIGPVVDTARPSVVSGVWSPTTQKLRVDAVDYAARVSAIAASAYGTSVGAARYTAGSPGDIFNGNIHSAILINAAVSDADLLTLERFTAWLQGRTL